MLSYSSQRPTDVDQWAPRVASRRRLIRVATDSGRTGAQLCLDSQQGGRSPAIKCSPEHWHSKIPNVQTCSRTKPPSTLYNTSTKPMFSPPEFELLGTPWNSSIAGAWICLEDCSVPRSCSSLVAVVLPLNLYACTDRCCAGDHVGLESLQSHLFEELPDFCF